MRFARSQLKAVAVVQGLIIAFEFVRHVQVFSRKCAHMARCEWPEHYSDEVEGVGV